MLAGAAVVVLDPVPGRRHERVARLPRQLGLADSARAAALDHVEDAAGRGAAGTRPLARAQPVRVGAHRGQRRRARRRHVRARDQAVLRRARRQLLERASHALPRPAELRLRRVVRRRRRPRRAQRRHPRRVERTHERDVEAVEPHDGRPALVAVIVPAHRRRDDEVAALHDALDPVHRGEGALALDHQPQRGRRVVVARRHLARQDHLQAGVERGGDRVGALQAGVLEHEHAALGLLEGHQPRRLVQQRARLAPRPAMRHGGGAALLRQQHVQRGPQRWQRVRLERLRVGRRQRLVARDEARHGGPPVGSCPMIHRARLPADALRGGGLQERRR